jgi:hypothetical protein
MKAIVNVNKESAYAHLNGHTFEVKEVLDRLIALDVNGAITDFGHKEVMIVDFQNELQKEFDSFKWNGGGNYSNLQKYAINNKIVFTEPKY